MPPGQVLASWEFCNGYHSWALVTRCTQEPWKWCWSWPPQPISCLRYHKCEGSLHVIMVLQTMFQVKGVSNFPGYSPSGWYSINFSLIFFPDSISDLVFPLDSLIWPLTRMKFWSLNLLRQRVRFPDPWVPLNFTEVLTIRNHVFRSRAFTNYGDWFINERYRNLDVVFR